MTINVANLLVASGSALHALGAREVAARLASTGRSRFLSALVALCLLGVVHDTAAAATAESVRAACETIWIHGIDQEIAEEEIGQDGVPHLLDLLADPEFGFRDNVVAFLGFLGGDETVSALRKHLLQPPARLDVPEEDRSMLGTPLALGHLARRGNRQAKRTLLELIDPGSKGGSLLRASGRTAANPDSLQDDLAEMAIHGLVWSGDREAVGRVRAIRRGTLQIGGHGRNFQRTARHALQAMRASRARKVHGSGRSIVSGGQAAAHGAGPAPLVSTVDASVHEAETAAAMPRSHGLGDGHANVRNHVLSYSYHIDVGSSEAMTLPRAEAIMSEADRIVGTESFDGDVACCNVFELSSPPPPGPFGSSGDSLDIIDGPGELELVMSNASARVKIVRYLLYCGGTMKVWAGCGYQPGWGIAAVRYSSLTIEAILLLHEYGHNIGLGHSDDKRMIMSSGGYGGGVDSRHCDRLHSPSSASDSVTYEVGTCADSDSDKIHDYIDNCPVVANFSQQDSDGNGIGSACDCGDGIVSGSGGESCEDGNSIDGDGCDSNCTVTACGNGVKTAGEECDDGNAASGDGCLPDCTAEYCGDGILNNSGETCEDGNTASGDGCSSTCRDEVVLCGGDGCTTFVTSTTHQGNLGGFDGADAICNARAQAAGLAGNFVSWLGAQNGHGTPAAGRLDPASGPFVRTCGGAIATGIDDLLDGYEPGGGLALPIQCDEFGSTVAPSGVWTGTSPDGPPLASCDEWTITAGQGGSGDESATNSTWTMLGDAGGVRSCSDPRRLYCIEQKHDPICGNGILQEGETCDDGNLINGDGCNDGCSDCGDGVVSATEQCDDGNGAEGDGCDSNCRFSGCGNGFTAPGEVCDDGNNVSNDGCSSACVLEYCGDGILNLTGESCEDGNTVSGDGCSSTCEDERYLCGGDGCTTFVTSTTQQGNLGGFAGADAICNARAQAAGLTGDFVAWLGAQNGLGTPAAGRLDPASGPFVRTCGGTIATDIADLLDGYEPGGGLALPIRCDEYGSTVSPVGVWTGTSPNGPPLASCDEWTTTAGQGGSGDESATNSTWTMLGDGGGVRSCGDPRRLYCIEQYHPPLHGDGIVQVGEECDDGNVAAGDCCAPDGTAESGMVSCPSDGNPCTDDVCDGAGHCGAPNTGACDDGLYCNGADTCAAGSCSVHAGSPCAGLGECADLCDEGADTCSPRAEGFACSDFGNPCVEPVCDGAGGCGVEIPGSCDDGIFCNGADSCAGGSCSVHAGNPCAIECVTACNESDDSCAASPAGTVCSSDGSICTVDSCDGAGGCTHEQDDCDDLDLCTVDSCDVLTGCVHAGIPMDEEVCHAAGKSKVGIKDIADPGGDSVKWKWIKGDAFEQDSLGRPDVDTRYALCIYDASAGDFTLSASILVDPSSEFWQSRAPYGVSYADGSGSSFGMTKISIKAGAAGKTKVSATAAGPQLVLPGAVESNRYFGQDPEVFVQLVNDEGACWSSRFLSTGTPTNTGTAFKASAP